MQQLDTYIAFEGDESVELGFTDDDVDLLADERTLTSDEAIFDVSKILSEKNKSKKYQKPEFVSWHYVQNENSLSQKLTNNFKIPFAYL